MSMVLSFKDLWDEYLDLPKDLGGISSYYQAKYNAKLKENLNDFLKDYDLVYPNDWNCFDAKAYGVFQLEFKEKLSDELLNKLFEYTRIKDYEFIKSLDPEWPLRIQLNNK